jgi:hypothetical protein
MQCSFLGGIHPTGGQMTVLRPADSEILWRTRNNQARVRPGALLASRHNHDGVAGCGSFCARASSCTCATGRARVSSCAGISGCAGVSGRASATGCPRVSSRASATRCARVSGLALRSGRACGKRKTSSQRERRQCCDKQFRIRHDDFLYVANENYTRYCEQSSRLDQFLATMISVGRSGHRYCKVALTADLHP